MNLAGWILKKTGWRFEVNIPPTPKCVICVAPHTSNWDFIVGEVGIRSVGMSSGFLMKDTWFFFPLGYILKSLGGIPVKRSAHTGVSEHVVEAFNNHEHLWVAVTPEGTRSPNSNWHKGFLHIAREAGVPIALAYIDYEQKVACVDRIFNMSDDVDADMVAIKSYYSKRKGKHPEKFVL